MKQQFISSKQAGRIHPLVATAAVAVTLASLVGIAAITGVIPNSHGTNPSTTAGMNSAPLMTTEANGKLGPNIAAVSSSTYVPAPVPASNYVSGSAPASNYVQAPVPKHVTHRQPSQHVSNDNYAQQNTQVAQAVCQNCGRVESVVAHQQAAAPSGVGIGVGAVVGGLLGNQVGGGNGRTLATVAGAVAGGYGGNEVEKRTRSTTTYTVRVRMDDGKYRSFPQNGQDGWRTGDRVRVVDGALTSQG